MEDTKKNAKITEEINADSVITESGILTESNTKKSKEIKIPFEVIGRGVEGQHVEKTNQEPELDAIDEVVKPSLTDLSIQMTKLEKHFESKIKYDKHKENTIDKLHHELQKYKDDLIGKLLRPIFMDIIEVIDDVNKLLKSLEEKGEINNPEKLLKLLKGLPEDLEDKLYRHGVEVVEEMPDVFDPSIQKIIKVLLTNEELLDKQIGEKLKNGYRWEGKLIRHEMVTVYKYQEKKEELLPDYDSE